MKKNYSCKLLVLLFVFLASSVSMSGQITIGSLIEPLHGSLIDAKSVAESASDSVGGYTSTRGISFPRVKLVSRDSLMPMYSYVGPDVPTALDAKRHRGLLVYNLFDSQAKDLEEGFYYWDGSAWTPLQKGQGNAVFEMDCTPGTGWQVQGQYIQGKELTTSNAIRLKLDVTRKGVYSILFESNNGYYFTASGIFDAPGSYHIYALGQGTPLAVDTNTLVVSTPNDDTPCTNIGVRVLPPTATFTFNCSTATVKGVYKLNTPLDHTNYIDLIVNVTNTGSYEFTTNEVDGISFYAAGNFTSNGTHHVFLQGSGSPTNTKVKTMTITGTSYPQGATSCDIKVVACFKKKVYAAIGSYNYGYTLGPNETTGLTGSRAWEMFSDPRNFGALEESVVKIESVDKQHFKHSVGDNYGTMPGDAEGWTHMSESDLRNLLLTDPYPDILFIGYYNSLGWAAGDSATLSMKKMAIVKEYLDRGGVAIMNLQYAPAAAGMIKGIFNVSYIKARQSTGRVFPITGNNDDPIINGPFGNVRGKYWGADVDDVGMLEGVPADQFYIYSQGPSECGSGTSIDDNYVSMARHRSLNLFWCGEAAWYATYYTPQPYGSGTSTSVSPFSIDPTTHKPITQTHYCENVFNSTLFGNVLYWALYEAEYNGINKD
jgi:type II secretory pathway pseudopilin PulG